MAGDYSRNTFDPAKHYARVLMQQGRVQLDADWNEQGAIAAHRDESEAIDVIGVTGAPKPLDPAHPDVNFHIGVTPDSGDLTIAPGRIWVNGLLCENDALPIDVTTTANSTTLNLPTLWLDGRAVAAGQWLEVTVGAAAPQLLKIDSVAVDGSGVTLASPVTAGGAAKVRRITTFLTQPDRTADLASIPDGSYLAFLDVWQREISALDDPNIREIALGGPDTARRLKTVWQLRLLTTSNTTCAAAASDLATFMAPSSGTLAARSVAADDDPDPCLLPPSAGFRGLENQLYRIEIQSGGPLPAGTPTFKWSRDDATVESSITDVSGNSVTVAEVRKDDIFGFDPDDWVELVDDLSELTGAPRALLQIDTVDDPSRVIVFKGAPAIPPAGTKGLKLRKWDHGGTSNSGIAITAGSWLDVEAGVQVRFGAGIYHSGDYWLVPARTAIHDVLWPPFTPNAAPVAQPPLGIRHHAAPLALVTKAQQTFSVSSDCRPLFPPLTDIWATDVKFDNTNCMLPTAKNVQEAIDALCARTDLRLHNKYLHGWGVVCGLQVVCNQGTNVTVKPGYALDCEGYDLWLKSAASLDITQLPGFSENDLETCLTFTRGADGKPAFALRPHAHKTPLEEVLDGTLLQDLFNGCLKELVDYAREHFDPRRPSSRRNLTALWNLLIQLWNPTHGSHVWISRIEFELLRRIYSELPSLAQSATACQLLDDLRPLPESYPFDGEPLPTIFGNGTHRRIRYAHGTSFAGTCGSDATINIYDVEGGELARTMEFPLADVVVRDVAFSADGQQLFAIAVKNDGSGSAFAAGNLAGGAWQQHFEIAGHQLVTLGSVKGNVLAVAYDEGLFVITPNHVQQLGTPVAAKGPMAVNEQAGLAFLATRGQNDKTSAKYNAIATFVIGANHVTERALEREGDDDLAFFGGDNRETVAIVVDPRGDENTKTLLIIDAVEGQAQSAFDLSENGPIHLTTTREPGFVAIAFEESYRIRTLLNSRELTDPVPVQICPSSLAFDPRSRNTYVLNAASPTITVVDFELLTQKRSIDLAALIEFRGQLLDAFIDLFGALFEALKDCACDKLLVDCPTCSDDDVVTLACLELRDRGIHKICNLTGRKYVKTFRTVGYWLSLVPLVPLLRVAVERFCCFDLATFAHKVDAPTQGKDRFHCDDALPLLEWLKKLDVGKTMTRVKKAIDVKRSVAFTSLRMYQVKPDPAVDPRELLGRNSNDVREQLGFSGVEVVGVEAYDPALAATHVQRAATSLRAGDRATIVERNGRVAYVYTTAGARNNAPIRTNTIQPIEMAAGAQSRVDAGAAPAAATDDGPALRAEVASLRRELDAMKQTLDRVMQSNGGTQPG